MKLILNKPIVVALLFSLLTACAAPPGNEKAQTGAIVGAVAGALFGAATSNKKNRAAGIALGAALGGGAGYLIGQRLDARDREALRKKIEEVASVDSSAETIWRSEHSGASAIVGSPEPAKMTEESKRITAESDVRVEEKALVGVGTKQVTTHNVNVRSGPGTGYPAKYVLPAGRVVDVVGTSDGGWQMIMENGVVVGYVSARNLRLPEGVALQSTSSRSGESRKPVTIDSKAPVEPPVRATIPTREMDVRVASQCKQVRVRIRTNDGQITEENVETCQRPDGTWGS